MQKTVIALVALVFTLLQWSYVAAGEFCAHESRDMSSSVAHPAHWGHHFHNHSQSADNPTTSQSGKLSHSDCGFCHAHFPSALFASLGIESIEVDAPMNERPGAVLGSLPPDAPERPNWTAASFA